MLALSAGAICDAVEAITGVTTSGHALGFVNTGYDRVLSGINPRDGSLHVWSFLSPVANLELAGTTTGTATGVYDGSAYTVITATTAIFSPTHVGDTITIATVGDCEITYFESSTKVWIDGSHGFVAQAVSIPSSGIYDLPSDFAGLLSPPVYAYDTDNPTPRLEAVSVQRIFEYWRTNNSTSEPSYFAIAPKAFVAATGQQYQILFYPRPQERRLLRYQYLTSVAALTDSATVYPVGGSALAYCIRAAALSEYEKDRAMPGQYTTEFTERMCAAIDTDGSLLSTYGNLMIRDE